MTPSQEAKLDTLISAVTTLDTRVKSIEEAMGGNTQLGTKGYSKILAEHDVSIQDWIVSKNQAKGAIGIVVVVWAVLTFLGSLVAGILHG